MDQVSRPMQFLLIGVLAFAAVWYVALRPKAGTSGEPATPPAAQPVAAPKSAIPGGLGNSVDKARAAKTQGGATAAGRSAQANAADPTVAAAKPAPAKAAPVKPSVTRAQPKPNPKPKPATRTHRARPEPAGASPGKVRRALARGHTVVLLFYTASGSDDRAVRSELSGVGRRGGRVNVWGVSVRGLSRFRNVLAGVQVLQTPSVLVLSPRGRDPVLLAGYTDRTEIDQVAAAALRRR
jgi:hypothetical protein